MRRYRAPLVVGILGLLLVVAGLSMQSAQPGVASFGWFAYEPLADPIVVLGGWQLLGIALVVAGTSALVGAIAWVAGHRSASRARDRPDGAGS